MKNVNTRFKIYSNRGLRQRPMIRTHSYQYTESEPILKSISFGEDVRGFIFHCQDIVQKRKQSIVLFEEKETQGGI